MQKRIKKNHDLLELIVILVFTFAMGFLFGVLIGKWMYGATQANASVSKVWCYKIQNNVCQDKLDWFCSGSWHYGKCPTAPTPTPTPTPEPSYHSECVSEYDQALRVQEPVLACVKVEGEGENECKVDEDCLPDVTPTPIPTPVEDVSPTPAPTGEPHRDSWTPATAPACTDTQPEKAPCNFHVYRKGDVAVLRWVACGANAGDKVNIYYRQNSSNDWQYSVREVSNNGLFEVNGLGSMDITFGLQQVNGCSGGSLASPIVEVVDGAEDNWVLFR